MSEAEVSWLNPSELSQVELNEAANWIRSMDPYYYELFGVDQCKIDDNLINLLFTPASEFGTTLFVRKSKKLAGFITFFPAIELFTRRLVVLKSFLSISTDLSIVKSRLKNFEASSHIVPPESIYLSKIYVDHSMRGSGLSKLIFQRLLDASTSVQKSLSLHVKSSNVNAVKLYETYGFSVDLSSISHNQSYLLMVRDYLGCRNDEFS